MGRSLPLILTAALAVWTTQAANFAAAQYSLHPIQPEARSLRIRSPERLPRARIPEVPTPGTVIAPDAQLTPWKLPLDEAIRIGLINARVVRVLAGLSATTSGRTIYDAAIVNTAVDDENARFDPVLQVDNFWDRIESPEAFFHPVDPDRAVIFGRRVDDYRLDTAVTKENLFGGEWKLGYGADPTRRRPGIFPLNPVNTPSLDLSYTQPLLQGGGLAANAAPIVLARIDTERSYFQFKDSLQDLVQGTIEAYWNLVAARNDAWVLEQQVAQAEFINRRSEALLRLGFDSIDLTAQTRVTLSNFRAQQVTAEATVLQSEAALRNILGLPPVDEFYVVPVTLPTTRRFEWDWQALVRTAEVLRPDLIELKLIIEADQQAMLQAQRNNLPRLDAVGLYRWNGIEGRMPNGEELDREIDDFTDWTLGVNFSVPLGLRSGRAGVRRQELILVRDRENLQQGLHQAVHTLAAEVRILDQLYKQYQAFRLASDAARLNLDRQFAAAGEVVEYIVLSQAITDWGNAVSAEANALTQYNAQLATLERAAGNILESHGVVLQEERFQHLGPLGFWREAYPARVRPLPNVERYPAGEEAAEKMFQSEVPLPQRRERLEPGEIEPLESEGGTELPSEEPLPAPPSADEPVEEEGEEGAERTSILRLFLPRSLR